MKTIPKPNKSSVLSILSILILVAILAFGIVKYEQHKKVQDAANAAAHTKQVTADKANKAQLAAYQRQAVGYKSKNAGLCQYLNTLEHNKVLAPYLTTPADDCLPVN